ncbi:MAG: DNA helicase RecQ [Planktomarina sp.]
MIDAHALLKNTFGFDAFRPGQADIVDAVASGQNVLAIMPTGGGKSLCYQLPALMRDGVTVVISPLIALMRDQVQAMQQLGICAGCLTSANTPEETDAVWQDLEDGRLRLLYIAPERLAAGSALGMLRRIGVGMIAVDEAHCVSQWGHDFRPDYLRIGELRQALNVPLAAFTATADEETRAEIVNRLFDGQSPQTFLHGFDRPNLHLAFAAKNNPRKQITTFAAARKGQAGIVYCGTRAKTHTLANALNEAGHNAAAYNGGMDAEDRRIVETRFQREDDLIVVATVAFGMGVDKPDVRWVAHADLPKSIEGYYQEIGRAGRDGAPAETLTLFGADDIRLRRGQIDESPAPADRKMADHARLNALLGLAEALECRRTSLLAYFGETGGTCGNCDLCDKPPETFDATQPVRMGLSAILRTGEWFGAGHLIDILRGVATDKVRQHGHDGLPTFGVGKAYGKAAWTAIFRQMMGHDLIRPDPERHGALRFTENARPLLKGEASITFRKDTMSADRRPAIKTLVSEEDAPLLSALKAKRRALAEAQKVPAYIIFNDKTLIEMAETRPQNLDEMARINGVGAKKLDSFGDAFLAVINGAADPVHPARRRLAGTQAGDIFDQLQDAQKQLLRGPMGTDKLLSCSTATLRKIADTKPTNREALARVSGMTEAKLDRFADAFLDVISRA